MQSANGKKNTVSVRTRERLQGLLVMRRLVVLSVRQAPLGANHERGSQVVVRRAVQLRLSARSIMPLLDKA